MECLFKEKKEILLSNIDKRVFFDRRKALELRKEINDSTGIYLKVYRKNKIVEYKNKLIYKSVFVLC